MRLRIRKAWRKTWLARYLLRCEFAFSAAADYLRDGDETLFDMRMDALDGTPLEKAIAWTRIATYVIGKRLQPVVLAATEAMQSLLRAFDAVSGSRAS